MTITLQAVYAGGWDGAIVNPMTRSAAEARDAAGDPYAVLLLDRGRVRAVLRVCWRTDYYHLTGFDARGNTIATCELRGPGPAVAPPQPLLPRNPDSMSLTMPKTTPAMISMNRRPAQGRAAGFTVRGLTESRVVTRPLVRAG